MSEATDTYFVAGNRYLVRSGGLHYILEITVLEVHREQKRVFVKVRYESGASLGQIHWRLSSELQTEGKLPSVPEIQVEEAMKAIRESMDQFRFEESLKGVRTGSVPCDRPQNRE